MGVLLLYSLHMNTPTNEPNHPFIIFSFALVAIIGIGGMIALTKPSSKTPNAQPTTAQQNGITFQKEILPRDQIISLANNNAFAYTEGPKDAQVTVVEYFDFLCPFSKQSASTVDRLLQEYKTLSVQFVFRQAPAINVRPASLGASNASLCAKEQGKFLPMYSLLFDQQKTIKEDNLSSFADMLGLDRALFDACMSQRKYQKFISKDLSDAVALELAGTPSWFINGKRYVGSMPFDVLSGAIDKELAGK